METADEITPMTEAAVKEHCRAAHLEALYQSDHITSEGTIKIGDVRKHYRLTKPLPQKGGEREAPMERFEGIIEIEGEPAKPYLILRNNKPGGWSESEIYIDGAKLRSVKRDWLPREFVYEGTFQANGQSHSYKIKDLVCRGDPEFKRDELEALAMMAAM